MIFIRLSCFALATTLFTWAEGASLFQSFRQRSLRGSGEFGLSESAQPLKMSIGSQGHRLNDTIALLTKSLHIREQPDIEETLLTFDAYAEVAKVPKLMVASYVEILFSIFIWTTLVVGVAHAYKGSESYQFKRGTIIPIEEQKEVQDSLKQWHTSWYQCCDDPSICVWACCCPCIRWAHTMDMIGFLEYWPACIIFCLLSVMNQLTGGVAIGFFFTLLLVFYRQKLRRTFDMEEQSTIMGYLGDFFCYCFCWPCTIAQEAAHIKYAAERGWTKDLTPHHCLFSTRASEYTGGNDC